MPFCEQSLRRTVTEIAIGVETERETLEAPMDDSSPVIEWWFDPDFVSRRSFPETTGKYDADAAVEALRRKGFVAHVVESEGTN